MTDRANNDLAALLTPAPSKGVQFSQGVVLSWNNETLRNQIEWRGITLTDVPIVEGINALTIRQGDVIGMLGWAPENAKGVGSWWILGKLSNPGEFVADLDVTAKLFRFVTETGDTLAFFGKEIDGDPLWFMTYGDEDETPAIEIANNDHLRIRDRSGNQVFGTDAATETGLARPYLNYHIAPAFSTQVATNGPFWPSQNSTSFTDTWQGINSVWHPRVSYGVRAVSVGGLAEWRIRVDNGSGFTTVAEATGSQSGLFDIPGWGTTVRPGQDITFLLQARNSGGQTWTVVDKLYGRQS